MFDVLLDERLKNNRCERRQGHEHLLVFRLEIAMRILDTEHDALGLVLNRGIIHHIPRFQGLQNLFRRLVRKIGQHHLYGQRIAVQKLHEPLELFAPAVSVSFLDISDMPLQHPLGQSGRRLTIQPRQTIDVVRPHRCPFTFGQPFLWSA